MKFCVRLCHQLEPKHFFYARKNGIIQRKMSFVAAVDTWMGENYELYIQTFFEIFLQALASKQKKGNSICFFSHCDRLNLKFDFGLNG